MASRIGTGLLPFSLSPCVSSTCSLQLTSLVKLKPPRWIICHNPAQQHLRAASGRDHPVRWDLGDAPRPHKQQLSLDTDFLCVPVRDSTKIGQVFF